MKILYFIFLHKIDIKRYYDFNIKKMPPKKISNVQKYVDSLSAIEKKALAIAKEDLGSSFNIEKSIGYLSWLKKNKL